MAIILRNTKGAPLTHVEMDTNFSELDTRLGTVENSSSSVTVSDTSPISPEAGDLWWNSDEARLKVYYDDGSSSQWVDSIPVGASNPFDQDLNTTDSVTFNVVTATSFIGDGSSLTGIPAGYTDSDVDTHLNTGTATGGQILSWNGSDYAWVADQSGIQLTDLSVGTEATASGDGGIAYDNTTGVFTYTPPDLSGYLTSYTETDPVVGAINGIVKADGAGNISAAVEGTDYTLADQSLDTTSNVTFNQLQVDSSITENNHTLTGTSVALDPANGTIQTHTLTGPTTYTDSLADGQSITLLIPATANTITWPTMKWQGGVIAQPDATNDTFISIFKVGTTLYGATIGVFI